MHTLFAGVEDDSDPVPCEILVDRFEAGEVYDIKMF